MKTFEELQNIWDQQVESSTKPAVAAIIKKAEGNTKRIKRNHFWTGVILGLTSLILISYYIWIGAYRQTLFNWGLGIMIVMLLFRIVLEWISVRKFNGLPTDVSLLEYSKLTHQFYLWRKKIHYIITPIVYLTYIVGFVILLPIFKESFSKGFFLYIVVSGFGFLLFFALLMIRIIKKEIQLLEFLKNIS